MHRIPLGKRFGRTRRRAVIAGALWLAGAGLATGVWATQAGTGDDPGALARTIKRQKIRSGVLVADSVEVKEHQVQALSTEQMLSLSGTYEKEIRDALEHAEVVRVGAYRARDIIRMTCIDEKLSQMRSVLRIIEPRFTSIHEVIHDELVLRTQFLQIQQAVERVRNLAVEMEECMGETLDMIAGAKMDDGVPSGVNPTADPTRPQDPAIVIDRPPEASSWR